MQKFKIRLACAFGASTATICAAMKKTADDKGIEVDIEAIPTTQAIKMLDQVDIVLLAPQVRYEIKRFQKEADKFGTPVLAIPGDLYGNADGEQILALALKEIFVHPKG